MAGSGFEKSLESKRGERRRTGVTDRGVQGCTERFAVALR